VVAGERESVEMTIGEEKVKVAVGAQERDALLW
jgi:hypothetical protein